MRRFRIAYRWSSEERRVYFQESEDGPKDPLGGETDNEHEATALSKCQADHVWWRHRLSSRFVDVVVLEVRK